jgi:predicted anti-sigma-YlaC factor YlaD
LPATILGNFTESGVDYQGMSCDQVRTALSALADGEDPGVSRGEVQSHLAVCPSCSAFAERTDALRRATLLAPAPDVADRTDSIMHALDGPVDRRPAALRISLAAIGCVQLAVALPLLAGAGTDMPIHDARHLAALDIAVAVGFLVAALRPARIGGLLPVVAAMVVALLVGSVLDVVGGTVHASAETPHLLAGAGLLGVWLLTRPPFRAAVIR